MSDEAIEVLNIFLIILALILFISFLVGTGLI